ncbi:MAG: tRNA uridine-5-carboxymethylaminomethyl(34) synthesis GTPase MnmE, partial [Pseudomonadota bacterium]
MSQPSSIDTITALASATGKAGVGIIRVSGQLSQQIAEQISGIKPQPRYAHYLPFRDNDNNILDYGILLYFPGPNSFTGEDIVEFQGHGGPIVLSLLLKEIVKLGARLAKPGEFSERAFINNKMDLSQAEAIADLIDSSSEQAAKSALKSLSGEFSNKIKQLDEKLVQLRIYVEAAIDFPQEEIDFLSDGKIESMTESILDDLSNITKTAQQGKILREGMTVAITGQPNVGKSSLLNLLSGEDLAIVTDIAGTTRDVLKQEINIDGMPLHIIDTAGLRDSNEDVDEVEKIGIKKAHEVIQNADKILLLVDVKKGIQAYDQQIIDTYKNKNNIAIIYNKIDTLNQQAVIKQQENYTELYLSVKKNQGIDLLKTYLKDYMGFNELGEGVFSARSRHLEALEQATQSVQQGLQQLIQFQAGELLAEELLLAQQSLNEITGEFGSDELLGRIFSGFCIG